MKDLKQSTKLDLLIEYLRATCLEGKPCLETQQNISYLLKIYNKNGKNDSKKQ